MCPTSTSTPIDDDDRTVLRPSPGGRRPYGSPAPSGDAPFAAVPRALDQGAALDGDNPLADSAATLLSLVPELRHLPHHSAVNELQKRLIDELKRFENRALSKGAPRNQVDISKYLLCALLDETVLNTPWGGQSGWGHNSLSSLLYKKVVGGVEFFQIIERLKQQPAQNKDVLELAYLCLSLGFEGKYRYTNDGPLALEREREALYLLLENVNGLRQLALSTQWEGAGDVTNPLIRYVPLWVLACVAAAVLMVVYMGFAFAMRDKSDRLFGELVAMAQNVKKTPPVTVVQPVEVRTPSAWLPHRLRMALADEIARKQVSITDDDKLRIFNMFSSGSAEVKHEYRPILAKIAAELQKVGVHIRIVGHTDNQKLKFSSRFKSNWHLSLARAESTAEVLGALGLPTVWMRTEGMADKAPIAPNNTQTNRALNRRIDLLFR
jgi:type VI secretion system protein ImpK